MDYGDNIDDAFDSESSSDEAVADRYVKDPSQLRCLDKLTSILNGKTVLMMVPPPGVVSLNSRPRPATLAPELSIEIKSNEVDENLFSVVTSSRLGQDVCVVHWKGGIAPSATMRFYMDVMVKEARNIVVICESNDYEKMHSRLIEVFTPLCGRKQYQRIVKGEKLNNYQTASESTDGGLKTGHLMAAFEHCLIHSKSLKQAVLIECGDARILDDGFWQFLVKSDAGIDTDAFKGVVSNYVEMSASYEKKVLSHVDPNPTSLLYI